jgi:hypothetical protein
MTNPNKPAFPIVTDYIEEQGMTLRDYFAGQALVGLLANSVGPFSCPRLAYSLADAMLKERVKTDDESNPK